MFTTVTTRVIADANARGCRVQQMPKEGNRIPFVLNQPGVEGTFGVIYVGASTGRITSAYLTAGNSAREVKYEGAPAVRDAVRAIPNRALIGVAA